jgi:orotidine-5'-phosphate decarboxylase
VSSAPAPFAERLAARVACHGALCVGIDPSAELLARCGLPDSAEGLYAFGARVLEACRGEVAVVKPQSAYFERHGSAGVAALERITQLAASLGVLVLVDGKRGDIDATAAAYGEALSTPTRGLHADASTWHAYLGFDALRPAFDRIFGTGGGAFVVVRSSNPEGRAVQLARGEDGRSVAEALADAVAAANARYGGQPLGAVVGATCDDAGAIVERLGGAWVLAPGVGAQGASMADIARRMPAARGRVLANVSRAIVASGGDAAAIGAAIARLNDESRALKKS